MRPTALHHSIFAAIALGASCAHAGDPASCSSIAGDPARLACYDAAVGRAGAAVAPAVPAPSAPPGIAPAAPLFDKAFEARSLLGERWSRYEPTPGEPLLVRLHNANYVMLRHSDAVNMTPGSPTNPPADTGRSIQRDELEFQVSFKARLWASRDHFYAAWLGYTQQSNWQVLNGAQSRPFRESDYQPEMMFVVQPDMPLGAGFRWQLLNIGLVHQSNGRSDPASRSWNRAYVQFGVENDAFADGKLAILVRPWLRLHERADRDDNPDITDFLGYGDVAVLWRHDKQTLTFTGRINPRTGKGSAQVEWSVPAIGPFRFYVQAFTGYGESLIDYNFRQTFVGAGFALNDLL
ncbi:MAG: phospholipase A [Casimicrobiaceae bacterium]